MQLVDSDLSLTEEILLDIIDVLFQLLSFKLCQVVALFGVEVVDRNLLGRKLLPLLGSFRILERNLLFAQVFEVLLCDLLSSLGSTIVIVRQVNRRRHPIHMLFGGLVLQ